MTMEQHHPPLPPMGGFPPRKDFAPPGGFRMPMADISWVKRRYLDIPYSTQSQRQKLDLYLPETGDGPFPVLIHIHGGGFAFGDKRDDHMDTYLKALHRGMAAASIEYRVSNEAVFPAAVLDCRAAVRYLRENAAQYSLDPERFIAIGGSAGGNLAAFLGMNVPNGAFPGEEEQEFSTVPFVQVAVDQFGPVRFETMQQQARENGVSMVSPDPAAMPESKYLGVPLNLASEELLSRAYPGSYASERMAPLLVQHGTADHLVPWAQSEEFAKDLRERGFGYRVCYLPLEGADHEDKRFFADENMDRVYAFIEENLKSTGT